MPSGVVPAGRNGGGAAMRLLACGRQSWQPGLMPVLDFLEARLDELRRGGLCRIDDNGEARREAVARARLLGVSFIDASSNDYLAYSNHPSDVSRETLFRGSRPQAAIGAGASRLIHGTRTEHVRLECELAAWVNMEASLLFACGYSANVGTISALAQRGDILVSDALNHASIIDGCRLSNAEIRVVPHLNLAAMEEALKTREIKTRAWVVTESYFSMDGDSPDLERIRSLCDTYDAIMIVDEAHALGVFGPHGAGHCAALHVKPDVMIGTFGKALGVQGAFVATTALAREWLWNRARSFVYSTAVSPLLAWCVSNNLRCLSTDDSRRARLATSAAWLRHELSSHAVPLVEGSHGPIIPVLLGSATRAMAAAATLRQSGILVQAVRPPTVPENSSRIRLTIHSELDKSQLERLARAVIAACRTL